VNISAPQSTTTTVSGVYDALATITAKEALLGTTINEFTVQVTEDTNPYSASGSTTNGTLYLPLIQNLAYFLEINATGYALDNTTLNVTTSTPSHQFVLYKMNTFNISILDEETNEPISNHSFIVQLISNAYATNITINGSSELAELLTPGDYEIRYWESGDNTTYSTKRSYYTTLTSQSYQELNLYAIADSVSGYYTPVVLTSSGYYAEGVIIKVIRGYIENETLVGHIVEMAKTDPNGQAVLRIVPNNVYYKFLGVKDSESFETNYFKVVQASHTFQLSGAEILEAISAANNNLFTLEYLNSTQTFRLTWNDPSGTIISGRLVVDEYSESGHQTLTDTTSTGSTGSIVYTLTNTTNRRFEARAYVNTTGEYGMLTDYLSVKDEETTSIFGLMGVFITLLVFLFSVMVSGSSEGVVVSGVVSILFMAAIGFLTLTWYAVVGIVIIAGVIVYKTRT